MCKREWDETSHIVTFCETKCRDPADRTLGASTPGLEATATLPLLSYGMAAWLGHAVRPCSTRGALIDGAEASPELSAFVRRRHAMS